MGVFDKIEAREDCEAHTRELEAVTKKMARDKLLACPHRKPWGPNHIKCEHAERQRDRLCVGFECPVIEFI